MAGGSLLALLDDIATVLDDVALATKKTAGVLGDDLALNAQQVTGIEPSRELLVVWRVAKGSLINKAILVPAALLISAVAPMAITPLLLLGGLFLCFEGVEKLAHRFLHSKSEDHSHHQVLVAAAAQSESALLNVEQDKIKGAIRTDFVLSSEIVVIALGEVANRPFATRAAVLVALAILMTVVVYGLVATIVKIDDAGLILSKQSGLARSAGNALLRISPWLMKGLTVVGTAAMFLVGGGIIVHSVPWLHHALSNVSGWVGTLAGGAIGVAAGAVALAFVQAAKRLRRTDASPAA